MQLHFKLRKTFTTSLSAAEATTTIQELLNSRSKFLFFSYTHYSGSLKGDEFTLCTLKSDRFGLSTFKIKGNIRTENPTTIDTRIVPPYMTIGILLVCVGIMLSAILFRMK